MNKLQADNRLRKFVCKLPATSSWTNLQMLQEKVILYNKLQLQQVTGTINKFFKGSLHKYKSKLLCSKLFRKKFKIATSCNKLQQVIGSLYNAFLIPVR